MKLQAKFKASYMGCVWYTVWGRDYIAEVEYRGRIGDYELSIANGDDVRRDMRAQVGLASIGLDAPPPEAIAAINDYLRQNWQAACARFGALEIGPPPQEVRAGRWTKETSWIPA